MHHLIMGTACGYGVKEVSGFVLSLRQTGYDGDIVFFTYNLSPEAQRFLKEQRVLALPIHPATLSGRYRFLYWMLPPLIGLKKFRSEQWRTSELWMHIQNGRYTAYARALENWTEYYDEVFLCDVRDVIFQRNPFEDKFSYEIGYYEEYKGQTIGGCVENGAWIKQAYGQKVFEELSSRTVICSGVTYLKMSKAMTYLRAMVDGMIKANVRNHIDQGIHNFLGLTNAIPGGAIIPQSKSPVLNIGCNPAETLRFNTLGQLLNEKREVASIVHQFDRHPKLAEKLLKDLKLTPVQ